MPQVAVIGAGPAGSIASILLARAGIDVTLIEQHRFPRDKVCGECLSALGIDILRRLRLDAELERMEPALLAQSILFSADGTSAQIPLPRPMCGISRIVLDQILLNAARNAGAMILQPGRCESIDPRVSARMLESNELRRIEADFVIVADGKAALMSQPPGGTTDFGFKAHFENVDAPTDAIELFGVDGHYGGVAPIEGGRWNIAFSVPESRLRAFGRDFDALFDRFKLENAALRQQMARARRVSDWLISPLPRFAVSNNWPPRVIPIGNAAAALEPIGGEGMGLAMRSAEVAAQAIIRSVSMGIELDVQRLQSEFRRLWNVRRFACRAGARIISSAALSGLGVGLASGADGPGRLALRLVGK